MEPGLYVDSEGNRFTLWPDGQVSVRYISGAEKVVPPDEREDARAWMKWKLERGSLSHSPGLSPKRGMRETLEDVGIARAGEGWTPPEVGQTASDLEIPAWQRASDYGEAPVPSVEERRKSRQEPPKPPSFEPPTTQAARKALEKRQTDG